MKDKANPSQRHGLLDSGLGLASASGLSDKTTKRQDKTIATTYDKTRKSQDTKPQDKTTTRQEDKNTTSSMPERHHQQDMTRRQTDIVYGVWS